MKKKRICMALAAALSLSLAISATALAAIPSDIGGHWAQGTIIQWTTNGYISGYPDGTFKPDNSITRAEFVVMVNKAMGYNKRGNAYFSDVSAAHWAYAEIMKGVEAGYITGNGDGTFRPDAPVTRQEAAVMISKILGLDQDYASAAKYVDYRYIPSWAAGYVGAVSKAGIMTGYPDGDFKSDRVLTRAESVVSLDKTKNYDGKVEEDKDDREVFEDYRLTSSSLSDKIIKGDLIISSSLSNRNVSLDNVKVEGKLIVEGGKTVTADDCEISELEMNRSDVEFDATGRTKVGKTTFEKYGKLMGSGYSKVIIDEEFNSYIELDANIDYVELDADTNVRLLENCVIETFEATKNADNATVNFNKAEVEDMDIYDAIRITGRGDINNMTVYKSGVKSSIRPDHLDTRNGASKPDYTSTSSGDVGYNPGSRYDDLTASRDDKTYSGGRYDDVKVTGKGVNLKNMTIYGNLTIDEDVRNSDIELRDLDIRGNVYIYGGGQSTVGFYDCEIEGNIYARKDYDNTPVGLYIDGDTVENFDGDLYIDDDGAILEAGGKLDNVYVLTSAEVKVDTNVKNLYVSAKTNNLTITAGTTVDKLSISSSSAEDSTIKLDGNVKEISTNYDITVTGSGNYDEKTGIGKINGKEETIAVTGVTLNKAALTLTEGASEKLTATVKPDNATNKTVTWTSSDRSIATVDANGKVTAVKAGVAKITAKAGDKTAECTVTVNKAEEVKVSIEGESTVKMGSTITLTAKVEPKGTAIKSKKWQSGDPQIFTVTQGKITPVSTGTAKVTVTVTTSDDKTYTAEKEITVQASEKPVKSISITGGNEVKLGDTLELTATVTPPDATKQDVKWSSSDRSIATVSKGVVTPVSTGTVTITATATDGSGVKGEIQVEVKAAETLVTGITVTSDSDNKVKLGETLKLTASVEPEGATKKEVKWKSENPDVATVSKGVVTPVSTGTVKITATATDGSGVSGSIEITVEAAEKEVTNISVSGNSTVKLGETLELTATVTPDDATKKDLTWKSENPNVATVSQGVVTPKTVGTTKITATATDGSGVSGSIDITVEPSTKLVEKVTINGGDTVKLGETLTLTANITPSDATKQDVKWSSSNPKIATVSKGVVTPVSTGVVTITAAATDGGTASGTKTINVTSAGVESVAITNGETATMSVNGTLQLNVNITPDTAPIKTTTWKSKNREVATVYQGLVTAHKTGTAVITVTTNDGQKTDSITITVQ